MGDPTSDLRAAIAAVITRQETLSHDFHKHYRTAATTISVTVIGLASGGIFGLKEFPLMPYHAKLKCLGLFVLVIVFGCAVQFIHFAGYKRTARWADLELQYLRLVELATVYPISDSDSARHNYEVKKKSLESFNKSNKWFRLLDWLPAVALILFLTALFYFSYQVALIIHNTPELIAALRSRSKIS